MAMDWAETQARRALAQYRKGTQISASCVEIYPTLADAIREAYKRGEAEAIRTLPKCNCIEAHEPRCRVVL